MDEGSAPGNDSEKRPLPVQFAAFGSTDAPRTLHGRSGTPPAPRAETESARIKGRPVPESLFVLLTPPPDVRC